MWLCLRKGKGKGDNTLVVLVTFKQLKYVLSNLHKNPKRKHLIQRVGTQDMIIQKNAHFLLEFYGYMWRPRLSLGCPSRVPSITLFEIVSNRPGAHYVCRPGWLDSGPCGFLSLPHKAGLLSKYLFAQFFPLLGAVNFIDGIWETGSLSSSPLLYGSFMEAVAGEVGDAGAGTSLFFSCPFWDGWSRALKAMWIMRSTTLLLWPDLLSYQEWVWWSVHWGQC